MAWRPPNDYLSKSRWENYNRAGTRIYADRGTPYQCSQADLDSLVHLSAPTHSPPVSTYRAFTDIIRWNEDGYRYPPAVGAAVDRIKAAINAPTYEWRPDIIIKMVHDIALVFFGGYLRGNLTVRWSKDPANTFIRIWGYTKPTGRPGQCGIILNAHMILVAPPEQMTPGKGMWSTMLHEMCQ